MFTLFAMITGLAVAADSNDWPQLAHDAGRTAHALKGVPPPYRARWIWCGADHVLRNKASQPNWPDALPDGHQRGANYSLPTQVSFTFSGRAQPIVYQGKVMVGDLEGRIYCLALEDGRTLWTGENPGGTSATLAAVGELAVATAIPGAITALDINTGKRRWRLETDKAITSSPLVLSDIIFTGCHDGSVYAVEAASGKMLWKSERLGAPIVGELCGGEGAVFAGAENMTFYKLEAATGKVLAKAKLNGQSFRMLHPVLFRNWLFVQTVQPICVGSEYVMESVMRDSPDIESEQGNILRWLGGDTNGGRWPDASSAWKHLYVLQSTDLTEPFMVPNGPADGCGSPAPPPTVDDKGHVLAWFKTAHPTLTARGSFGTKYSMDISAINLDNGRRLPIDNGHLSGTTGETDNLFALSSGGSLLYLRQRFRGTKVIDLDKSSSHYIQAAIRRHDGGDWLADVVYRDTGGLPRTPQKALGGREAVVVAGDKLLFTEEYAITCVEHREP